MPQTHHGAESDLVRSGAELIASGHRDYLTSFRSINLRARTRFEARDWAGMQADTVERLDLYQNSVGDAVEAINRMLGTRVTDSVLWKQIKASFSGLVAGQDNRELSETFYNSVTRRIFGTVGVDPLIEYVSAEAPTSGIEIGGLTRTFAGGVDAGETVRNVLDHFAHNIPYANIEADSREVGIRVTTRINSGGWMEFDSIEMVNSVFYRGQAAYLVGAIHVGASLSPVAISLRNHSDGILVDAVLLTENEVSILFSFTRSYFHVDVDNPAELVRFLSILMPRKRIAELYISVGHNKHGKTELYRDLLRHVNTTDERFEHAPGTKGLVMIVFTMPGYDDVFKIIRDRFPLPKRTTRAAIMRKYKMVFHHDRAGRLMDVQDFQHLEFHVKRFDSALLDELVNEAGNSVSIDGDSVVINHVYVERRIVPLDVFVKEADHEATTEAVLDYGQAIKDLASTNIFPGDLLVKNFGVTRHGRVVFYDYDELAPLTEVTFKKIPEPRDDYDTLSDQPWYPVADRDVFPEEHRHFLGLTAQLRDEFEAHHGDLFEAASWQAIQKRIRQGELIEVFPYTEEARLPNTEIFRGW
jgi:isocitrate dehydrogenase kinase/phosphatase